MATISGRSLDVEKGIPPISFAHVVIRTSRIDEMIEWYKAVLCASVIFCDDIVCFLTYDSEHHRVALLNLPRQLPAERDRGGVDHFSYGYRDLGCLLSTYYRLKSIGILPVRTINHGPTISFYYRDPEGVKLELQVDNFETLLESHAFFTSPDFAENPIGVLVDPDKLRADWEGGIPWETIRKRPPLPPGKTPRDMQVETG